METDSLSKLLRRHIVKVGISSLCCMKDVAFAVGEMVGQKSIKSTARMNMVMVLFLEKMEQVNTLVEMGIMSTGCLRRCCCCSNAAHNDNRAVERSAIHYGEVFINNRTEEFDYRFIVQVAGCDYVVFATSYLLKYFGCGEEGHPVRAWLNRAGSAEAGLGPDPTGR